MRRLDQDSFGQLTPEPNRLETPAMAGYRVGMSSSGVIGRKLCTVFSVERDVPCDMDSALRELRSKLDQRR